MSEETVSADKTAALGIVLAVGCSSLAGLMYVLALMFSVQVSFHARITPAQANLVDGFTTRWKSTGISPRSACH